MPLFANAPFRVVASAPKPSQTATVRMNITPQTSGQPAALKPDDYLSRLIKLIPTEVLVLYLTFKDLLTSYLGYWSVVCLVLVALIRSLGTQQKGQPIQWVAVGVAVVSFILWVYGTGGFFLTWRLPDQNIALAMVGVWAVVVPLIYKGDSQ